jgi:hypothetical protein
MFASIEKKPKAFVISNLLVFSTKILTLERALFSKDTIPDIVFGISLVVGTCEKKAVVKKMKITGINFSIIVLIIS